MSHHTDRNKGLLSATMMRKAKASAPAKIPAEKQKQIEAATMDLYKLEKAINNKDRNLIKAAFESIAAKDFWDYLPNGVLKRHKRLTAEGNILLGIA